MERFLKKMKILLGDRQLRKRLLFIAGIFIMYRLLSSIPIPGVDTAALSTYLGGNQFLGVLNIFSGGALSTLSIVMLGVGPYITASIIMQLLTVMSPKIKEMYHQDGEIGRKRFQKISRYLTVPIAAVQGFGFLQLLSSQGVINFTSPGALLINIIIIVAGAMLITWLGELISEFGFSNGVSLLIFAGLVALLPAAIQQLIFLYEPSQIVTYVLFALGSVVLVAGIIYITEAERPVPVVYAKQARGGQTYGGTQTYIPLRINMAGVMPLIFAISILLFPTLIANFLINADSPNLINAGNVITRLMNNGWFYSILYFVLVVLFTYFYTSITFDPNAMASNLQKSGAFIPGVRPGKSTEDYIANIVSRITLVGALFLAVIAVIPVILQSVTGVQSFGIGGTGLLIVVAVIIDFVKKIDAQVSMREY